MWDLGTATVAVAVVAGGALVLPPAARWVGGICGIIGLLGVLQERTWGPTVVALGLLAWLVGHWSFAVRNDARYRSRLARAVISTRRRCGGRFRSTGNYESAAARMTER